MFIYVDLIDIYAHPIHLTFIYIISIIFINMVSEFAEFK